ncbi:hypothetical protein A3D88_03740 [Candidatus Peribacteria bacterium RIFCSPHIGHO2_02_FULL_52_16]|nr:MAG: hypothetical protein A2706_04555 [Candidatus Peribacteria bacterium RIFCSPHIGHO2_01_FULL_51_35]OGJ61793.1 MAG: hypothetical protein A3D88_03740 [Candidatus Peribacteria bacterium RIFCSPHIGHO2_02_FULL_52_16]
MDSDRKDERLQPVLVFHGRLQPQFACVLHVVTAVVQHHLRVIFLNFTLIAFARDRLELPVCRIEFNLQTLEE